MKIYNSVTWDMETGEVLEEDSFEYEGPVALCDRAGVQEGKDSYNNAVDTASGEGASANGISANLTPFLTQQMLHPQGYSQGDQTQMLNQAEAGAGGATSAITGSAADMAARTRNPSAFTSNLDEAARQRDKAAAGTSEGIAANDAGVKLQQSQDAAKGLGSMYGDDTDAMLKSMGMQSGDINAQVDAGKSGWLQNTNETMMDLSKEFSNYAQGMKGAAGLMG